MKLTQVFSFDGRNSVNQFQKTKDLPVVPLQGGGRANMHSTRIFLSLTLFASVVLGSGCQLTTATGMYRGFVRWRCFREPQLVLERAPLADEEPALFGRRLKTHALKWHDQNFDDPRYEYTLKPEALISPSSAASRNPDSGVVPLPKADWAAANQPATLKPTPSTPITSQSPPPSAESSQTSTPPLAPPANETSPANENPPENDRDLPPGVIDALPEPTPPPVDTKPDGPIANSSNHTLSLNAPRVERPAGSSGIDRSFAADKKISPMSFNSRLNQGSRSRSRKPASTTTQKQATQRSKSNLGKLTTPD